MDLEYLEFVKNTLEMIGGIIAICGAGFAVLQWQKGNDYKRAEIVQQLIAKINDDNDIALVLEMIDWSAGFRYDGKFYIDVNCENNRVLDKDEEELFNMIDKTLSHCSFICYLYLRKCLSRRDMHHFEYTINSLMRNVHIRNYLFSLNHFARRRGTECAFQDLIEYSFIKGYLNQNEFNNPNSDCFDLCLIISDDTEKHPKSVAINS